MSNVFSFTSDAIHSWDLIVNPSLFPQDDSYILFVDVQGKYNNVDTAVQGYETIAAAYKPGVKLTYVSKNLDSRIAFGAIYDTTKSGEFWQDNVGITHLILQNSPARNFDSVQCLNQQTVRGSRNTNWLAILEEPEMVCITALFLNIKKIIYKKRCLRR